MLQSVLLLVIDERSMLSMDVLGSIERNCRYFAYNGHNMKREFGGIPLIQDPPCFTRDYCRLMICLR